MSKTGGGRLCQRGGGGLEGRSGRSVVEWLECVCVCGREGVDVVMGGYMIGWFVCCLCSCLFS